ncbi:MAG: phosphate ABC transporter permease subunit PstC [Acidimicrobiia bacterium]
MTKRDTPTMASVSLRATGATRRRLYVQSFFKTVFGLAAAATVGVTVLIVLSLLLPAIRFFQEVFLSEFFGSTRWAPLFEPPGFGVWPIVAGTAWIMVISLLVAIPFGLGVAIYLSEYAHRRVRAVVKPFLEILAGIPTVVLGFFGLFLVNPEVVQRFWPVGNVSTFSGLAAGLVVGVMIIPTVASLSEDAMTAVPGGLREAGFALGGTRREVATKVVFPAALSGIVASIVLAGSRAIGETTIVLLVAGSRPTLTLNPGEQMQSMASFIGFAGIGDQPTGSTGYLTIFAVGLLLFIITFLLNLLSIRIVRRFREVYQ